MQKELIKEITSGIISIIIVIVGLASFFYNPTDVDMRYLQVLMGAIVGFYLGIKQIPVFGSIRNNKK